MDISPNGEYDWIVMDPDIDFGGILKEFDTFLIGRKTFEAMGRMGNDTRSMPGIQNIVFSRTLRPSDYPQVTMFADAERVVTELRAKPGKDIALFGGGELFRHLPDARRSNCANNACTRRPARSASSTTS
jgi:dihydrofolate reductase